MELWILLTPCVRGARRLRAPGRLAPALRAPAPPGLIYSLFMVLYTPSAIRRNGHHVMR